MGSADTARGHDQLRARIERDRARGVQGPGSGTRHVSTTRYVSFVDRDTAESESYFIYFTSVAAEPRAAGVGRYSDRLVRLDGRWKLASRRILLAD
jgi:3-phenylpropionate/cinnamic acid dioxygenase small subunit